MFVILFTLALSRNDRALILGSGTLADTFPFHDLHQFCLLTQPMTVFLDEAHYLLEGFQCQEDFHTVRVCKTTIPLVDARMAI